MMPPTQDALRCHTKRANFQAAIMKRSLQNNIKAPSPDGNGWHFKDQQLCITWNLGSPAPSSVLQTVHCGCKVGHCNTGRYSCQSAQVSCTALCRCIDCENVTTPPEEKAFELIEDSSDDSEDEG